MIAMKHRHMCTYMSSKYERTNPISKVIFLKRKYSYCHCLPDMLQKTQEIASSLYWERTFTYLIVSGSNSWNVGPHWSFTKISRFDHITMIDHGETYVWESSDW